MAVRFPDAIYEAKVYNECEAFFSRFSAGHRGVGVRLNHTDDSYITVVDVDMKDWVALASEELRKIHVRVLVSEALYP